MLIDTHAHLAGDADADTIIARAAENGVGVIVCATAHPDDWAPALRLADKHENIFVTIGIHPEYADQCEMQGMDLDNPKIIGIGEIGLDYHFGDENKKRQIELFKRQLDIARTANLPVAIHCRDAEDDAARILHDVRGVMHCFTGSWEFAKTMLDRGFYFSASGIITFKNSAELRDTFAKIPNDRIVIETDAPYCAPVPFRGKKCEPAMVLETARTLAAIKNLQMDELEIILENNTKKLYPKCRVN